jgi:hypothetical protein
MYCQINSYFSMHNKAFHAIYSELIIMYYTQVSNVHSVQ